MKQTTRELILSRIDKLQEVVYNNDRLNESTSEYVEYNEIESNLAKSAIRILRKIIIEDSTECMYKITDAIS
jgi:fibrillarin-like rRNA methylase